MKSRKKHLVLKWIVHHSVGAGSHQELQEDGQMTRGEGHQESTQAAVDDSHAGSALRAALAGLLQRPDGLDRAEDHHQRRSEEAKHLQADDHRTTPTSFGEAVEAVKVLRNPLPELVGGGEDDGEHQRPHGHADPQGHAGGAQLLGPEGVTDGHPAVHGDAHDGVDAAVYSHKVQAFQGRAEGLEGGGPLVVAGVHLEGQLEQEEQVHQGQAAHVDGRLGPLAQEDAEHEERNGVEDGAQHKDGDVDGQLQVHHQVVDVLKGAVR